MWRERNESEDAGRGQLGRGLVSGQERRAVLVIVGPVTDKHSTLAVLHDDHDHPDDFFLLSLFS